MSFQFVNNWPYSNTTFPTMIDHVDPVNNEYFAGLMEEIGRVEYYLGIHPQGSYKDVAERLAGFDFVAGQDYTALVEVIQTNNDNIWNTLNPNVAEDFNDVKDKLENHGHTGGTDGAILVVPAPGLWEDVDFVGTPGYLEIDPGVTGGSDSGFAYFDIIYASPAHPSAGPTYITAFNTTTLDFNWQVSAGTGTFGGAVWSGQYGIFTNGLSPGKILRFNPATWEEIFTTLDAGDNDPRQIVMGDGNAWFPCYTSPARIGYYSPTTHAHQTWVMDAGENQCDAICDDGTYLWACCNTNPVKLIKFKKSDKTHIAYTLTDFLPEVKYMFYHGGMVYMFSDNATPQWARFNPAILGLQRWETDWPVGVDSGCWTGQNHIMTLGTGSNGYLLQFDPDTFVFHLSKIISGSGSMYGIRFANNRVSYLYGPYKDQQAPVTLLSGS